MSISVVAFTEPRIPDLHICDELYGKHLLAKDCLRAAAELPSGSDSIEWVVDVPGNPIGLPLTREYGELSLKLHHQSKIQLVLIQSFR